MKKKLSYLDTYKTFTPDCKNIIPCKKPGNSEGKKWCYKALLRNHPGTNTFTDKTIRQQCKSRLYLFTSNNVKTILKHASQTIYIP